MTTDMRNAADRSWSFPKLQKAPQELLASGVSALGQLRIVASMLPLLLNIDLELVTVLDY